MIEYDRFLSRAGERMQASAIRRMGTVLAQARDMISFAPGYPAEDIFPWQAFAEYAANSTWIASHLVQFLGVAGLGAGLVVLNENGQPFRETMAEVPGHRRIGDRVVLEDQARGAAAGGEFCRCP
mgnify:CR=1 FL=1